MKCLEKVPLNQTTNDVIVVRNQKRTNFKNFAYEVVEGIVLVLHKNYIAQLVNVVFELEAPEFS